MELPKEATSVSSNGSTSDKDSDDGDADEEEGSSEEDEEEESEEEEVIADLVLDQMERNVSTRVRPGHSSSADIDHKLLICGQLRDAVLEQPSKWWLHNAQPLRQPAPSSEMARMCSEVSGIAWLPNGYLGIQLPTLMSFALGDQAISVNLGSEALLIPIHHSNVALPLAFPLVVPEDSVSFCSVVFYCHLYC